ncbi:MAG: adenosylmethionine--8-amino-7-oxononanoate transaminase [Planctomycetes bacterium]|nr:adenosylmethionine--8-amino-7-oxononanoate transaminase [Planctomycetota bacterium]
MSARDDLAARDARVCWHPYTQHGLEAAPLAVRAAQGAVLTLHDGREILDAISSWWATLHGHAHPALVEAMASQARELDHVLFAGATHEPAVRLAEELVAAAPAGLTRVFYSDNGSTAVEVALKMARQAWVQRGEPARRVFVALEGAYHGDTFGAMSVGDPDPFFLPYAPLLFEVRRVPADGAALRAVFEELGERCAGFVGEPLVQGAAGMRMHGPEFLREVRALCDAFGTYWIADEVMTGFGRTGTLFACEQAGVAPDLLCLAKGLTGGTFPLAATLATEALYEAFLSSERGRAFFHGHTFTAHPVGCRVGLASLALCRADDTPARLARLGERIERELRGALGDTPVRDLRRTGGIVAFDLAPRPGEAPGYLSTLQPELRRLALEHGVLLRPLGDVLYALPPACTSDAQAARIAAVLAELARYRGVSA